MADDTKSYCRFCGSLLRKSSASWCDSGCELEWAYAEILKLKKVNTHFLEVGAQVHALLDDLKNGPLTPSETEWRLPWSSKAVAVFTRLFTTLKEAK